ncbi:hypothetical protein ANCCAN_24284 [Ancylostoma caninum]|uniref:Protein MIS12 homolog n=1 Tax=Ancylostoma caninum TaxID=29170 RepID=A0A368FGG5_ANCCA|nr:hypothetical protein ANCCAN_24284 [Ancylostoma caninum]
MNVPEVELINEFEYQYYGFSPAGFTDSVYNIAVDSWEEAVKEVLSSATRLEMIANNKKFLSELTGMIFYRKEVKEAFNTFTERVLKYIFRIPRHVTLPEHEASLELLYSDDPNLKNIAELNREVKILSDRIVEKRFVLHQLNEEIQEANDVIEVLLALVMEVEKVSPDVENESIDTSDVSIPDSS